MKVKSFLQVSSSYSFLPAMYQLAMDLLHFNICYTSVWLSQAQSLAFCILICLRSMSKLLRQQQLVGGDRGVGAWESLPYQQRGGRRKDLTWARFLSLDICILSLLTLFIKHILNDNITFSKCGCKDSPQVRCPLLNVGPFVNGIKAE